APMADPVADELLALTQRLLDAIAGGDWATYEELCDPSLTAFEPEALGQLVEGLAFHQFYFKQGAFREQPQTTMSAANVRVMGDVAVVAYVRLIQRRGQGGPPQTSGAAETRVWARGDARGG